MFLKEIKGMFQRLEDFYKLLHSFGSVQNFLVRMQGNGLNELLCHFRYLTNYSIIAMF